MEKGSLIIRDGTLQDVAVVAEFNRLLALETEGLALDYGVLHQGVSAVLGDASKGRYFLAEDEGIVIGQTMITYEWSDWRNGWFWWIQSVYIAKEARGRGRFRRIHDHISSRAMASKDVCGLRLYVDQHNRSAQEVYLRLGLARSGYELFERVFERRQPPAGS